MCVYRGLDHCAQWLLRVALLFLGGVATVHSSMIEDADHQGLEALAYSQALQAYLYTYPLIIGDRELRRRERLTQPMPNAPMAPVNQLGHMARLANAKTDMPYSPNNDTVYTGVVLDISQEPIVLHMPAIKDRYAVVQVANAYFENQPYSYSPRVNGAEAANLAFVGPGWQGDLPEGVEKVAMDTVHVYLAIRIALEGAHELDIVRSYQNQIALTALSDWQGHPSGKPPKQPAPRKRRQYQGAFAFFEQVADLMMINPPPCARMPGKTACAR